MCICTHKSPTAHIIHTLLSGRKWHTFYKYMTKAQEGWHISYHLWWCACLVLHYSLLKIPGFSMFYFLLPNIQTLKLPTYNATFELPSQEIIFLRIQFWCTRTALIISTIFNIYGKFSGFKICSHTRIIASFHDIGVTRKSCSFSCLFSIVQWYLVTLVRL